MRPLIVRLGVTWLFSRFEDWSERTPPIARFFLMTVVSFGIVDLFLGMSVWLDFCPYDFLLSLQRGWRLSRPALPG